MNVLTATALATVLLSVPLLTLSDSARAQSGAPNAHQYLVGVSGMT